MMSSVVLRIVLMIVMTQFSGEVTAKTYNELWKSYEIANKDDLPQSKISILKDIVRKATVAKDYGQLLKAQLLIGREEVSISPDSLQSNLRRLKDFAEKTEDKVLASVYYTAIGSIVRDNYELSYLDKEDYKVYYDKALAQPELLAQTKIDSYLPFVVKGIDSKVFDNDLLSIIAVEAKRWEVAISYYEGKNKAAVALLYALAIREVREDGNNNKVDIKKQIENIDKLISQYGDASTVIELVIERYYAMTDDAAVTLKDKADYLQKALERYINEDRVKVLRDEYMMLTNPTFSVSFTQKQYIPNQPIVVGLNNIRNVPSVKLRIYSLNTDIDALHKLEYEINKLPAYAKYLQKSQQEKVYNDFESYVLHDDSITISSLPIGAYIVEVTSESAKIETFYNLIYVSNIGLIYESLPKNTLRLIAVDATTGKAIPQAKIVVRNGTNRKNLITNEVGEVMYNGQKLWDLSLYVSKAGDVYMYPIHPDVNGYYYNNDRHTSRYANIYTDRSLYKLGDRVGVTVLGYEIYPNTTSKVLRGKKVQLTLRDVNNKIVDQKDGVTDIYGKYSTEFTLPKEGLQGLFSIYASVENCNAVSTISVEDYKKPTFFISIDKTDDRYKDGDTVHIKGGVMSYSGMPIVGGKVVYKIVRSPFPYWYHRNRGNSSEELVKDSILTDVNGEYSFDLAMILPKERISNLQRGYAYDIQVSITNASGETHEAGTMLYLFDKFEVQKEEKLKWGKDFIPLWVNAHRHQFINKKEKIEIEVGSSFKDAYIYYSIVAADSVIKRGVLEVSNSILKEGVYYKDAYGDGVVLSYTLVKDGKHYSNTLKLIRPIQDNKLYLKWKTFRNKVLSGSLEVWTLNVKDAKGKPAKVSLLATMYDASLELIKEHTWQKPNHYVPYLQTIDWKSSIGYQPYPFYVILSKDYKLIARDLDFSHFYDLALRWNYSGFGYESTTLYNSRVALPMSLASVSNKKSEVAMDEAKSEEVMVEKRKPASVMKLRDNEQQAAFFYPSLNADINGDVDIRFTLPEGLTTWRFMALATDTMMRSGMIEAEVVAQKMLMVQPNLPRFLRIGDKGEIKASLSNTSEKTLSGRATACFIDKNSLVELYKETVSFSVEKNSNKTLTFNFDLSDNKWKRFEGGDVICKIVAESKEWSDGEQQNLPILSRREFITTTRAFTLSNEGKSVIDFTSLLKGVEDTKARFDLSYTSNPAYLVIGALPYISEVKSDNAVNLAVALYATKIANKLLHYNADVRSEVQAWKEEGREASVLSRYFDANLIDYNVLDYTDRLRALQNLDGSFSWYKGMKGSPYITMEIAIMLARLQKFVGEDMTVSQLLSQSLSYLRHSIAKEVLDMKENESKGIKVDAISEFAARYLYVITLTSKRYLAGGEKDYAYLLSIFKKSASQLTIYGKALASIVFNNTGDKALAEKTLQSVVQYSVYTDEMGRYYDTPKAYYSWFDYKIPTQTAVIEALREVGSKDKRTIEEFQRWLLQEKRTTVWRDEVSTVNAASAFFHNNEELLSLRNEDKIIVNNKVVKPKSTGLGEVSVSGNANELKSVEIEKADNKTSWGAIYVKAYRNIDDLSEAQSGMRISREVITEGEIKVGSVVTVRIIIEADRDYDFVKVEDNRAACLMPVEQLSQYHYGYYRENKARTSSYYFDMLSKGRHVVEQKFYIDRVGEYGSGTCSVSCTYNPSYSALATPISIIVKR